MIAIFLADGCEEIEALTVVDIVRRAGIDIKGVSIKISGSEESKLIRGSHGIEFMADLCIDELDFAEVKMIVLPGGLPGTVNLENCDVLIEHIKKFNAEKKYLAAICAAPGILGRLGMLKDREAVSYPSVEAELSAKHIPAKEVAVSDNIITSRGMGTAIAFSLKIVEIFKGEKIAADLGKAVVYKIYE